MKTIIYSDLYLPTFPQLEIPLFNEIRIFDKNALFVLQEGDYRLVDKDLAKIFRPISTIIKNPKKDLLGLVDKNDLCVMRFVYKYVGGEVASVLKSNKRKILMLDPAAIDIKHRQVEAQYVTAKSKWMKDCVVKKFPKAYRDIFVTGTIHFDLAFSNFSYDKRQIMEMHGLDSNKKLAILCKASPGESGYMIGIDDEYKNIASIVKNKCKDYELIFKAHPLDHHSLLPNIPGIIHKNEHYNNRPSWEIIFPKGITVLKPEVGYNAFKVADVVLNTRSSIGMETSLFPTPLININSDKYVVNWPKSNDCGVMKNIKMEELENILNDSDYYVDKSKCKEHVLKYCDPMADGLAYKRTAQVIKNLV